MSTAEQRSPHNVAWRRFLLLTILLVCPSGAQAAGGVLDGKLADDALADISQQANRQDAVSARRLDSHFADRALADVPWPSPAGQTQKTRSAFASLQDGLRNVPLAASDRMSDKNTAAYRTPRKSDLTSVLATLKNEAISRSSTSSPPQSVEEQTATAARPVVQEPKLTPIAKSTLPPAQAGGAMPLAKNTAPPLVPQRVTTGVLTGLRLLPPEQNALQAAVTSAATDTAAKRSHTPNIPIVASPANPASTIPAGTPPDNPAFSPTIVIEVLPPPIAAMAPETSGTPTETFEPAATPEPVTQRASTVTNILTGLGLLPAAQPVMTRPIKSPPQAFRTGEPPDKMPLFITARSGETVKIAPPQTAPLVGKAIADEALSAYAALTPPRQTEQPLHYNGLDLNLAVSPPEEAKAPETREPPDQPAAASKPDANQTDDKAEVSALKKKASEATHATDTMTSSNAGDNATPDLRQELWKEWSEKVILLEQENKALRGELAHTKADPLQDIRMDAVAKIKEQVLRERIIELEREVLEAQSKAREAALNDAAKKAADAALAPPPGLKEIPIKP